jgi:glycosyltransferase involved in cell wall biosynthesis
MARIAIARPPDRQGGNLTTALRWQGILTDLGHQVSLAEGWEPGAEPGPHLLIALHARRSGPAIEAFRAAHPEGALIVAATGTDLYEDLPAGEAHGRAALAGFEAADRILVLQDLAPAALPEHLRPKTRVLYPSVQGLPTKPGSPPISTCPLQVSILAELRRVKDPLLVLDALELIPQQVELNITHAGAGDEPDLIERARAASQQNSRYQWVGALSHEKALELLAQSHLTLNTSRSEGCAGAVVEALALDIPLLASNIAGNRGVLGETHPGLFGVGDASALAAHLRRACAEEGYREDLRLAGRTRLPRVQPEREVAAWTELLCEVLPTRPPETVPDQLP